MESNKKKEALELMKKAADLLLDHGEDGSNIEPTTRPSTSRPSGTCSESSTTFKPVSAELRRLFSPYNRPVSKNKRQHPTTSTISTSTSTWSHKFFCLPYRDSEIVPCPEERKNLFEAGLGEKKINFIRNDNVDEFNKKLEEIFPKLQGCGGWELLRTTGGSRSTLSIIKPGKNGAYSAEFLANSYLGQAVCYIRPIQEDLCMDIVEYDCDSFKRTCKTCGKEFPLLKLREHVQIYQENKGSDEDLPVVQFKKKRIQPICSFMCFTGQTDEDNPEAGIDDK